MKESQKELRLSLPYAKSLLSYDPDSGIFVWRTSRSNGYARHRVGTVAGRLDSYGYLQIGIDRVRYRAHRLAWFFAYGKWPDGVIDHINGIPADNRLENLRDCHQQVNSENQRNALKNNALGLLGVCKNICSSKKPFRAQIMIDRRSVYIGSYATAEEAHEAYLAAKRAMHSGCTI